jgi:hypothetical protein
VSDWSEVVRDRLLHDDFGPGPEGTQRWRDVHAALRHIDTLTGYVECWKARAEKAEVERLRAALDDVMLHMMIADPATRRAAWERAAALRGGEPTVPLDSPDFRPKELEDFSARGYRRINRGKP